MSRIGPITPEEEPWEREIGGLLGSLPPVDPPPGFIDSALDHRPLFAGRALVGLVALALVAMSAAVVIDLGGRAPLTPPIDDLTRRHRSVVQSGVLGSPSGPVDNEVTYSVRTPVDMPEGYQRARNLAAEDVRQALYARDDEAVSIFVQTGKVRWESLPQEGLTEIDGATAWIDESRLVTVIQAGDELVTIIGLSEEQSAEVLRTVPRRGPTLWERAHRTANAITGQLGYPDLD